MSEVHRIDLNEATYESQDFVPSTSQFFHLKFPMQHCIYESQNFKYSGGDHIELAAATYETGTS